MLPVSFTKKHGVVRRKFIIAFTKLISKLVSHIVTVSEYSKNDILKYLNKRDSDVSIIYNFIGEKETVIEGKTIGQDGNILTKEGPLHLNQPYICTVSSLQPGKNLGSLIKAFHTFHKRYPNYHLYLCGGKGWGYQVLFDLVRELNASDYIHFTGYIKDEELDKIYSGCEGVAYVSYFEGFGIPPLEGFYHGKTCVASIVTSLPEVVGNASVLDDRYDIQSISSGLMEMIIRKEEYDDEIEKQKKKFNPQKETNKFINLLISI